MLIVTGTWIAAPAILFASTSQYVIGILMTLTALFVILLVLVQRGRGGGLAGAFGGMGGQSAFGTKAGDTFTKITIGASIFWLLLCIGAVRFLGDSPGSFGRAAPPSAPQLAPRGTGTADEPLLPETSSDSLPAAGAALETPPVSGGNDESSAATTGETTAPTTGDEAVAE